MIKLLLTFCFLFGCLGSYGQTTYQLNKDTSKYKSSPLYVLKRLLKDPLFTSNLVINNSDIDSVSVIKPPGSVRLYGEKAGNGVVEINLKNRAVLLTYNELLTNFNISYTFSHLPVFIDSAIAHHPKETYFEVTAVKSVKLQNEQSTGLRYISILSIYPVRRMKKGEVYIGNVNYQDIIPATF